MFKPWKYQEVYLYRTDRPSGWGRHIAYVGRTCAPALRHQQHMARQPWSDLRPRRYVLIRVARCPEWFIGVCEYVAIKATMPVYNIQHNRSNPRRITPWRAREARLARNAGSRATAKARDVLYALPTIAFIVAATYFSWTVTR